MYLKMADHAGSPVTVWCRLSRPGARRARPHRALVCIRTRPFHHFSICLLETIGGPARAELIMTAVFIAAFMGGYHWWRLVYAPPLSLGFILIRGILAGRELAFLPAVPPPSPYLERHPGRVLGLSYGTAAAFAAAIVACYVAVLALHRGGARPARSAPC